MNQLTLRQLYEQHQGKVSDKWSIYLGEYNRLFAPYRHLPVRMLEIGIQNGGSLELWCKFFPLLVQLVGCDINPDCAKLSYADDRIAIIVGDANTDQTEDRIAARRPQFDLIIDDGSHTSGDIYRSFARYFPRLVDGGLFVVEDMHCSYWRDFEGGLFDPTSSMAFFKRLADVVNHEHWGVPRERKDILASFARQYGFDVREDVLKHVHSVEFINSMCVIRKEMPAANVVGERFIAGTEEIVVGGHAKLHRSRAPVVDERGNRWSGGAALPEDEFAAAVKDVKYLTEVVGSLRADLTQTEARARSFSEQLRSAQSDINRLTNRLEQARQQQATVEASLAEHQKQARQQQAAVEASLAEHQKHARQQQAELETLLAGHQAQAREIFASTSWRVTAPVRWLGLQVGRVQRTAKLVPVAIEHGGGIIGATRRMGQVLRDSGLNGVRLSARNVEANVATATVEPGVAVSLSTSQSSSEPVHDYEEWLDRYDRLDDDLRARMRGRIEAMNTPLISVVMPTYNANPMWLRAAIESVHSQIYPHWELCIADDASTSVEAREVLRSYAASDDRIKVVYRPENGHIAAASNSALELVSGAWVALMDHDDLLSEHALFWIADSIDKHPDAELIYSDEDKIDEAGIRKDPYFKPDWNVDLFYSQNMFSHLGVYKTELLRKVGGFRVGMEGSQDYDLVLRCLEHIESTQVHHVPKVLYHWRVHAESTAKSVEAKPYAQLAGERALNEHFERSGIRGHVEYVGNGYRARYELPNPLPLVSLIIPTRNAVELVRQCVNSILARTTYDNYEIIIVDNGSDDAEAREYFRSMQEAGVFRVIRDDREFNYSALNNQAVALARGEIVGLVNNDIEVISPEWLSEMVSIAIQPGVGAVGARLWYPTKTLQHGGVVLGVGGVANHAHKDVTPEHNGYFGRARLIQSFSAVTAACLVVKKERYQVVSGLNEVDLKVAFNDVDFCLRLREAGYRNVWTPYAELFHHESATRGSDVAPEKQMRFAGEVQYMMRRWGSLLPFDPAYNPNLSLQMDVTAPAWPALAWPPRERPDMQIGEELQQALA